MTRNSRTALLICCSKEEASTIHERAETERRSVSGYVLNIVMRAVKFNEELVTRGIKNFGPVLMRPGRVQGPRTSMLVRCAAEESARIRTAAKHRDTTISGFVLASLRRSWLVSLSNPQSLINGRRIQRH
jgi:uncharacterized protein (DUF1778 family)